MKLSAILATYLIFVSGSAAWSLELYNARQPDKDLEMGGTEKTPGCQPFNQEKIANLGKVTLAKFQPRIDLIFWHEPPVGVMLYQSQNCTGGEFPIWDSTNRDPNGHFVRPPRVFKSYALQYEEKADKREALEEEENV